MALRSGPVPMRPKRPSSLQYARLVRELVDSAARQRAGGDILAAQRESLQAVLTFINADPDVMAAILPSPLAALHNALHDAQLRGGASRPTNLMRHFRRGHLAAALNLLIVYGGMKPGAAAQWLQAKCWRVGVHEVAGQRIEARRLLRWRNDIIEGVAPNAMTASFDTLAARYKGRLATPADAQASALLVIENLRRLIPPESIHHTGKL